MNLGNLDISDSVSSIPHFTKLNFDHLGSKAFPKCILQ